MSNRSITIPVMVLVALSFSFESLGDMEERLRDAREKMEQEKVEAVEQAAIGEAQRKNEEQDEREAAFLKQVEEGEARRFDFGGGIVLDLLKVGTGDDAFWLGRYEVTQEQYQLVMGANPSGHKAAGLVGLPVENVSWYDAENFCKVLNKALSAQIGDSRFVLPDEAQWERAAYAGRHTIYAGGDDWDEVTGNRDSSRPVGEREPNQWGFYDMSGNVREWCRDVDGESRGYRGGDYDWSASVDEANSMEADESSSRMGFRVALVPEEILSRLRQAEEKRQEYIEAAEKRFLEDVANGTAKRLSLGEGVVLDMIKVGDGVTGFWMGRYEVTQRQYEQVMGRNPSEYQEADCESHPVEGITLQEAEEFCKVLNLALAEDRKLYAFTLPTSEQWWTVARAEDRFNYAGGDQALEVAWYEGNSHGHSHSVGLLKPNGWGFHDMSGNVGEICRDGKCRGGYFGQSDNAISFQHIWSWGSESTDELDEWGISAGHYGFRVVLALPPESIKQFKEEEALALAARQAAEEKERQLRRQTEERDFLSRVATGEAKRIDLGDGIALDLIRIDDTCYIGRFEITREQYRRVMGGYAHDDQEEEPINGSVVMGHGDDARQERQKSCPAVMVSWYNAKDFCIALNRLLEKERGELTFALPTAAQWEEAAYAGDKTVYSGSDDLDEVGWYDDNSDGQAHPVGEKKPNAWGIHDMSGNVWEWCLDGRYGSDRACCGGSWNSRDGYCRVGDRIGYAPDDRDDVLGFRVVASRSSK